MRSETIRVDWLGPSMNTIWAGKYWSFRKRMADDAHWAVKAAVGRVDSFLGQVTLDFYPKHKGRLFDISNYAPSVKGIEDGLVLAGILLGDSAKIVKRITIHEPERMQCQSYMLVRITDFES